MPGPDEKKTDAKHVSTPMERLHRWLLGDPIPTSQQDETRLPKILALPVFSSDAISSVAYATQEILLALGAAGLAVASRHALYARYTWGVTIAICILLAVVAFSYRQTISAYPSGGGSYLVSKDNLGVKVGLVAAAALLIDYVLTVAVSIAAGVQNLATIPLLARFHVNDHLVPICLVCLGVLTYANLRGLKQAGALFALPTYLFIALAYAMILLGTAGSHAGWHLHLAAVNQTRPPITHALSALGLLVVLRAFANGCSAMTGTEAISNGIPAFKKPETTNAANTLLMMAVILGTLFVGISALAMKLHVVYWEHNGQTAPAVIDQLSGAVFGRTGHWAWLYYAMQFATATILILAANTSFADFPRLASILANDRFVPRYFAGRGDRLVFSSGIVLLGLFSALLLYAFKGSVDRLIPLYALGVFTAFTLSQSGMVVHWFRHREKAWHLKALINGIGAVATGLVFGVILYEKFPEGAWIVVVLAVALVALFHAIHRQYDRIWQDLQLDSPGEQPPRIDEPIHNTVLVLVGNVHRGIVPALRYACSICTDVKGIYVEIDPERTEEVRKAWNDKFGKIPLEVLPSPFRSIVRPVLDYVDRIDRRKEDVVTLIVPDAFTRHWWDLLLHNVAIPLLRIQLIGRDDVVVTNVRYRIEDTLPEGSPLRKADENSLLSSRP